MGPLPAPSVMREYDEVFPGAAERIMLMAENEQKHRQVLEQKMVRIESRDSLLGVICAALLGVVCAVSGAILAIKVQTVGGSVSGMILGVSGVASIVGTFLKGTTNSWKKQENKDDEAPRK